MDNPFEDLKRDREKKAREISEERARKQKEEVLAYENYQETVKQFSKLVMPILEQLRLAVYPHCQLVGCFSEVSLRDTSPFQSGGTWRIGKVGSYSAGEAEWWNDSVVVVLEFDTQTKRPVGFICHRAGYHLVKARKSFIESLFGVKDETEKTPYQSVRSALSHENLVNALKQLHS